MVQYYEQQNSFVNPRLTTNDRKRGFEPDSSSPAERPRQRRRLEPEGLPYRQRILQWLFGISCQMVWPRSVLFTTAYILDCFAMGQVELDLATSKLCGLVAMFIATKIEADLEVLATTEHIVDIARAFGEDVTRDMVLEAEFSILKCLGIENLWINHPYSLWNSLRVHMGTPCHDLREMTKFLIDVCTMDSRFHSASPSHIVAASLWVATGILKKRWTRSMSKLTGFTPDELLPYTDALIDSLLRLDPNSRLYKEWSRDRTYEEDSEERVQWPETEEDKIWLQKQNRRVGGYTPIFPSEVAKAWAEGRRA